MLFICDDFFKFFNVEPFSFYAYILVGLESLDQRVKGDLISTLDFHLNGVGTRHVLFGCRFTFTRVDQSWVSSKEL